MISDRVRIVECPRDAWQSMPRQIPAEIKAGYLRALIRAGFRHIDAVSFVSPKAVPQMADSESVLSLLGPVPGVEIIGIVVNQQGAERAIRTGVVTTLGFPFSVSPSFLERNQKQTIEGARRTLEAIGKQAASAGLGIVVYVSMAFGNPYGDPWQPEAVIAACRSLEELGLEDISLADTVGLASAADISGLLSGVLAAAPSLRLGAHLHARREQVTAKLAAAYQAGCRRFDMALGGQGGCPFAQDALVGNVATELALAQLSSMGAKLPVLQNLNELLAMSSGIADRFGAAG